MGKKCNIIPSEVKNSTATVPKVSIEEESPKNSKK
jgi:hypothetical protein